MRDRHTTGSVPAACFERAITRALAARTGAVVAHVRLQWRPGLTEPDGRWRLDLLSIRRTGMEQCCCDTEPGSMHSREHSRRAYAHGGRAQDTYQPALPMLLDASCRMGGYQAGDGGAERTSALRGQRCAKCRRWAGSIDGWGDGQRGPDAGSS